MKRLCIEDIQKMRFDRGCIVYNTNNYRFGVVMDGNRGDDADPCSEVWEIGFNSRLLKHTPPNRALVPTGRFVDIDKLVSYKLQEFLCEVKEDGK